MSSYLPNIMYFLSGVLGGLFVALGLALSYFIASANVRGASSISSAPALAGVYLYILISALTVLAVAEHLSYPIGLVGLLFHMFGTSIMVGFAFLEVFRQHGLSTVCRMFRDKNGTERRPAARATVVVVLSASGMSPWLAWLAVNNIDIFYGHLNSLHFLFPLTPVLSYFACRLIFGLRSPLMLWATLAGILGFILPPLLNDLLTRALHGLA